MMNNKSIYLYMQRFFSKILVKPLNSKSTNLQKKNLNLSRVFFQGKNRKIFLNCKNSKKEKKFVILVYRSFSATLCRFDKPTGYKSNVFGKRVIFKQACNKVKRTFFYLYLGREPIIWRSFARLGADLTMRNLDIFCPFGPYATQKTRVFGLSHCRASQVDKNFVKNELYLFSARSTIKFKIQALAKSSFFKRIKNPTQGKWCIYKFKNKTKFSLRSFYFVFFLFLKIDSQNLGLNLILDSLSSLNYFNKTSLLLINLYRISKLYKQILARVACMWPWPVGPRSSFHATLKHKQPIKALFLKRIKMQLLANQKLYNNLKFLNFDCNNCSSIPIFFKNQPFISRLKLVQLNSFSYSNFSLARPLLSITRFDTFYLSESLNLPIYPDKTNLQVHFLRNRVRKQILPAIRILVNPQFDTLLCNFSETHLVIKKVKLF